jgi:hypothetical protein
MFVVSCVIGWAVLLMAGTPLVGSLARAALTSVAGAYVELITKRGYDTVTVPLANACVLLLVT